MPNPSGQQREIKVSYSKKKSLWMTVGVILFLCLCYYRNIGFFDDLENKTIDMRFKVRGPREMKAPIRVLAVDEKSLQEIGQWPWPRAIHAKLIRKLKTAGVQSVFYDIWFPEPERRQDKMLKDLQGVLDSALQGSSEKTRRMREKILDEVVLFREKQDGDRELAKAIQDTGIVYLPMEARRDEEGSMPNPDNLNMTMAELKLGPYETREDVLRSVFEVFSLVPSIPSLQKASKDSGHIKYYPNPDGIIRAYPTVIRYKDSLIPSLGLQIARDLMRDKEPIRIETGQKTLVADRSIPLASGVFAFVNYCGNPDTKHPSAFPVISACDVLNDRMSKDELKGMVVVFGATAAGLQDLRPTPFVKNSPGLEVNANIIENVFTGNFLKMISEPLKYLLIIFLALSMWYLVPRLTPIQGTISFSVILSAFCLAAFAAFSFANTVILMTYPSISLLLTFLILTTYKFRTEVKHSRYMKQMFQSVVAPKVVEEILEKGVDLAGEEKELTVMFSDIRGFTTYSEKHTPHEVVDILNEYLTQMTMVLLQTEGTLDKYIGDAIMAFWGAPGDQKDHAYRACSTALGMVDLLHSVLHPKWQMEGKEKLEIGLGLNTGKIVVGYVGSQFTRNYTLIGDPVNLCSRLEGTTKEYKVEIIISETTFEQVKDDMLCRELDLIQVKGKHVPIRIYELVDHRLKAAGAKELKVKAFQEGLAYYRACRFEDATKSFKNCLDLDPKDGPAQIFIERCKLLEKNPPPKDWDGVFVMKSK